MRAGWRADKYGVWSGRGNVRTSNTDVYSCDIRFISLLEEEFKKRYPLTKTSPKRG